MSPVSSCMNKGPISLKVVILLLRYGNLITVVICKLSTLTFHSFVILGVPFPKNYFSTVKKILTRLHRVFVHVYIHHFDKLVGLGAVSIIQIEVE